MNSSAYDFFLFIGQSNMAGRAIVSAEHPEPAPQCLPNAGFEFRAISDPSKLYPIEEPFGINENINGGICETSPKTGSLVTAFTNAYFENTKMPLIGLSASKGGSGIAEWLPGTPYMNDTLNRLESAYTFFEQHHLSIRHKYMVWCQGERDGQQKHSGDYYINHFNQILSMLMQHGIEHCFMLQIGHFNPKYNAPDAPMQDYSDIINAQSKLCISNPDVTMVSTKFSSMLERGLMHDTYHYFQEAYNEVGTDAGINTASFVKALHKKEEYYVT